VWLQVPFDDGSRGLMRGLRSGFLGLLLVVIGLLSVFATSFAPTEAAALGVAASPRVGATNSPDGPKGRWRLVFSDHFTGTTLDSTKWSTCYHWGCTDLGNNELEWYQASQVTVRDSTVSLTVVPEQTNAKDYVSGMLSSYGKFSFRYGYAQIVAKLPVGKGLWSAFWMEPESVRWPPEIDVLENWAETHNVSLYVHYNASNQYDSANLLVPTASSAFHTYGVDWEPGSINWYVDGIWVVHLSVSITQPEYLIADLAVNGRFPPNSSDRFPQSLVIRSIRVWQHPTQAGAQVAS
jgi:beta-glucanase (GH16 family)